MKPHRILILNLIIALVLSMTLATTSTMAESFMLSMETNFRCGNLLMRDGLEKLQVLANCGDPVATERSYVERYGEVEKLVYGPDSGYYYVLYFYVGKLINVETIREL